MRRAWFPTTVYAAVMASMVLMGQTARAEKADCGCDSASCDSGCDSGCDDGCLGGCRGGGLLNRLGCGGGLIGNRGRRGIAGWDAGYNCGCNGSYNYPVPPLYTYHWPGLYKQQLMTDYHSPWRFPAIKPYVDEAVARDAGDDMARETMPRLRPIGYQRQVSRSAGERSVSELMQQLHR